MPQHEVTTGSPAAVPPPRTAAEVGPDLSALAVAYVDALDGGERTLLLRHIAQAFPEVVEAGVELLAQWRAECAEHRRKNLRRRDHDRRRRRRAEAGGRG